MESAEAGAAKQGTAAKHAPPAKQPPKAGAAKAWSKMDKDLEA